MSNPHTMASYHFGKVHAQSPGEKVYACQMNPANLCAKTFRIQSPMRQKSNRTNGQVDIHSKPIGERE